MEARQKRETARVCLIYTGRNVIIISARNNTPVLIRGIVKRASIVGAYHESTLIYKRYNRSVFLSVYTSTMMRNL
jgi:hypothetical protein